MCFFSLSLSFFAVRRKIDRNHTKREQTKVAMESFTDFLDHGVLPMVSVPVCLIGFCEAGKSSFSRLLTSVKLSSVTNSTKVASSFSITPCQARNVLLWKRRKRETNACTLAAAITFASKNKDVQSAASFIHPSRMVGSSSLNFSLSSSNPEKSNTKKKSPPAKQIPPDVAEILDSPSNAQSLAINFNASPEMILPILDCGGQPMYLEAIPLLVGPRCIYCIVYNLMWKLNDYAVIKFWKDGALLQHKVSSKTYLEHVVEWISIIDCQFSKECDSQDQPTALFIGTHFDLFVKEMFNNDRMEAHIAANDVFERIKTAVKDKLSSCKLHIKAYYVDNTTAGTTKEDVSASSLRSLIQEMAMQYSVLSMPISWLCLLHHLQYYSKSSKPYLHITEVKELAGISGVKRDNLEVCLQVLHRLAMLFWFHNVEGLQGYIFTDLNWFFKELGRIFLVPCVTHYESEWKHLQRTGIVTSRLQSFLFEGEFIKGWSLRVLASLGLCGEIEDGSNTAIIPKVFFMNDQGKSNAFSLPLFPSMIEATAHSPPRTEYISFPDGKKLTPLFFVFSPNESVQYGLMQYTPPGFFTHLISKLTDIEFFSIVLDARERPVVPSYCNQFTFCFGSGRLDDVTIRSYSDCIQVTIERKTRENRPDFTSPAEISASVYKGIYNTSQLILQKWMPQITIHPSFFCRDCKTVDHFAVLHNTTLSPFTLSCTKTSMVYSAQESEMMWFHE